VTWNFINRSGKPGAGLVVGCDADGTIGVVVTIVMVVKGLYHGGKEEKDYEKK